MPSQDSHDESPLNPTHLADSVPNSASGEGPVEPRGALSKSALRYSSLRAHFLAALLCASTLTLVHYVLALIPSARNYRLVDLVPVGYVTFCGYVILAVALLLNIVFRLLVSGRGWSRRDVLPLYGYYTRLAVTGIICAALVFYFAAGFVAGDLGAVIWSLSVAVALAVLVYLTHRFKLTWFLLGVLLALLRSWAESRKRPPPGPLVTRSTLRKLMPLRRWLLSLNTARRAYAVAAALFVISFLGLIVWLLVALTLGAKSGPSLPFIGLLFSLVLFAAGAAMEIVGTLLRLWATTAGKFLLGLLSAFVVNASYVFAKQEVNRIARIDPSSFNTAVATIGTLLVPVVWVGVVFTLLGLTLALTSLWAAFYPGFKMLPYEQMFLMARNSTLYRFLFNKSRYKTKEFSPFIYARIIGVAALMVVFMMPLVFVGRVGGSLRGIFTELFIMTETYADSRCPNQRAGERVAFVGDGKILAVSGGPGRYVFEVRPCE